MALVKKGSFWYIVYDFDGKQIWKSTHTDNKDIAAAIQKTIQANNAENKLRRKVAEYLGDKPELIPPIIPTHKKRLKINAILPAVEKYRTISPDHRKAFSRFTDALPDAIVYADQITADVAFNYLQHKYKGRAKSWNNNKTALYALF
jgi:hypothetical protein